MAVGSSALSGASTGFTFGGPWGAGIGAGLGALSGWLLGRGKKSDHNQPAQVEDPYTALLTKQSEKAQAQGEEATGMSMEALGPVLNYYTALMGSNPSALLDATRQERGRVIDQYDTARKAIANFGPRGGGTTSTLAQSRFDQAESLADITSNARRSAVASASQLGVQLAGLGLTAEGLASSDLNTIINAALNREYLQTNKRGQNLQAATGIGETVGSIIGAILTRGKKAA